MDNSYTEATRIYKRLPDTTSSRNRKVKIAAIRRAIVKMKFENDEITVVKREGLPLLQQLILTYTGVAGLSRNRILILEDLDRYLSGEVEG